MTTPLTAALAYARQAQNLQAGDSLGALADQGGASFAETLKSAVETIDGKGKTADATLQNFTDGKGDILSVVTAINESEVAMETLVSVRDRMINAYQEIIRMPI